jgi:hypothetical protein
VSGALIVFAKHPEPGKVKTRMCPPFSSEEAADLYAAMLEDVLAASEEMARTCDLVPILAIDPPEQLKAYAARLPSFRVIAQRGGDLSARMENAASELFAAGFAPVLLRGSDSPAMSTEAVASACAELADHDLVICPDRDGGYNLVGFAAPAPGVFDHPMSTGSVLEDTLALAKQRGLQCKVLPAGFDLDTADDFGFLREADAEGKTQHCSRTILFLTERGFWVDQKGIDA